MSEKDRSDPDGTEMVDIGDADVSAVPASSPGRDRSVPPPLPPEVRASAPPMIELSGPPSNAPMPPPAAYVSVPPPPPRSNRFYAMLIVAFVAVGVIVGLAVAFGTRGEKKTVITTTASGGATPAASGSVMTLPTIDMNDDEDGGK